MYSWEEFTISLNHWSLTPVVFSAHGALPVDGTVGPSLSYVVGVPRVGNQFRFTPYGTLLNKVVSGGCCGSRSGSAAKSSKGVSAGGGSGKETSSMVLSASGCWQNSHCHSISAPSLTAARYTSRDIPVLQTRWFQRKQPLHWRPCWRGLTGSLQATQLMIWADAMVVNWIVWIIKRESLALVRRANSPRLSTSAILLSFEQPIPRGYFTLIRTAKFIAAILLSFEQLIHRGYFTLVRPTKSPRLNYSRSNS